MKAILAAIFSLLLVFAVRPVFAQDYDPFIQSVVEQVSYDTLQAKLLTLESFGRKEITDPALGLTAEWLIANYTAYGYTDIQTDPFTLFGNPTYNIIVTRQGTMFPDEYLIIDGHYDTKTGPGVNDNGSGVAIILEIARLLKDVPVKYSIKFINFSAEEYGMVGSSHYVDNVVIPQNMNIRLVYNIDEVGGVAGMVNDVVVCERDQASPESNNEESWAFTDTLAVLAEMYSDLNTTISYAYGSDYVPFQANGEIITGIFEDNYSPYAHTLNDNFAHLDMNYVFEMAKTSVAAGMYFAGAYDTGTGFIADRNSMTGIEIYPNPFRDFLNLEITGNKEDLQFVLLDETGSEILSIRTKAKEFNSTPTHKLKKGFYIYQVKDSNGLVKKSGKVAKLNP
jgi:hypothetical protein